MNSTGATNSIKQPALLLIICLVGALSLHLFTLWTRPAVFVDEAITLSRVEALLKTGIAVGELDDPVYGFDYAQKVFNPNLPYYFFAVPTLFGFDPSIESLRVMSFSAGMLIIVAVGFIASRSLGRLGGLGAMVMTSISPGFVYGSHVSRPDVLAAGLGYLALAVYSIEGKRAFGAAFLAVLAFSAHQRSVILSATLAVLVLFDMLNRRSTRKTLVSLLIGGASALVLILLVDILPYGSFDHFIGNQRLVAAAVPPPFATGSATVVGQTVGEFLALVGALYPIAWLLVVPYAVRIVRDPGVRRDPLSVIVCVSLFMSLLCVHGMLIVKAVIFSPSLDLLFASLMFGRWRGLVPRVVAEVMPRAVPILFLLSAVYVDSSVLGPADCREQTDDFRRALREHIPAGANVMGEENLWIFLRENQYVSWKRLPLSLTAEGMGLERALRGYRPDYLLIERDLSSHLMDEPFENRFHESVRLPRSEFIGILKRSATSLGDVDLACYGSVQIFKLNWTAHPPESQ